jgi:hypothetical protein
LRVYVIEIKSIGVEKFMFIKKETLEMGGNGEAVENKEFEG